MGVRLILSPLREFENRQRKYFKAGENCTTCSLLQILMV
jgi:hypothetical protein